MLRAQDVVIIAGTPGGIATAVTLVEYHKRIGGMSASELGASDIENQAMIQGFFASSWTG